MPRTNRGDKVDPSRVQVIHAISRTTRACWLLGDDPLTGINYDHRKQWIEDYIQRFAANFGIDVLAYSILSNHHHQLFRSRPDVVETWSDDEVARRWMMISPKRKDKAGRPKLPSKTELDQIRKNPIRLAEIRTRLSDVSWWVRLLNQRIAQRANREDGKSGRFFEDRFKGIPVIDEASVLACSVYVDLNWIRASMARAIEDSDYTSAKYRLDALRVGISLDESTAQQRQQLADSFLAPIALDEANLSPGPHPSATSTRCSDKGFLPMSAQTYLELLDWTARQVVAGKSGRTPEKLPPVSVRLGLTPTAWLQLVTEFEDLFIHMAGNPSEVGKQRGLQTGCRFHTKARTRELYRLGA